MYVGRSVKSRGRRRYSPLGRLAASDVGRGLLGLLAQAGSAVGVLLSDRLAIGQVLGSIDDQNEGADLGTINAHVGENAGRVHPVERVGDFGLGRHGADISSVAASFDFALAYAESKLSERDRQWIR